MSPQLCLYKPVECIVHWSAGCESQSGKLALNKCTRLQKLISKEVKLTSVVFIHNLLDGKLDSVLQIRQWQLFLAIWAYQTRNSNVLAADHTREAVLWIAVRADNPKFWSCPVLKVLEGLCLKHRTWHHLILLLILVVLLHDKLVLLHVHAETLCNKFDFNAIDMLNQPRNWWQQLLRTIPVNVNL